jgi:hypothetical protein
MRPPQNVVSIIESAAARRARDQRNADKAGAPPSGNAVVRRRGYATLHPYGYDPYNSADTLTRAAGRPRDPD